MVVSWHKANVDLVCEKSSAIRIDAFFTGQFKHSYQHRIIHGNGSLHILGKSLDESFSLK